jgi:cysteine desulfurase
MAANNVIGTIQPLAELACVAKARGVLFHTDAVQAVGKVDIDLKAGEIDMLSLSGHKIHGPKGVGALYLRKGVKFTPLIRGGRQERGRRAGTENAAAIVGLGKAAELAAERLGETRAAVGALRDRLEVGVAQAIGECLVLGDRPNRLPNTSDIAFEFIDSEAVLHKLQQHGVAASSGSACASGTMEPSHVLRAMNVRPTALQGAVRFSLSRETTAEEIDRVLAVLPEIVAQQQSMSPLWRDRSAADAGARVA